MSGAGGGGLVRAGPTLGERAASALPLATGLAAVLVDLLPLPSPAPQALAPLCGAGVLYFWTLHRPDLMTPLAAFLMGLLLDAGGGMPLGLSSLAFLLVRSLILAWRRLLLAQPFAAAWACFLPVMAALAGLRWLLASLWQGDPLAARPLAMEAAVTVAIYPVVGLLLAGLHHRLGTGRDAARG